MEMEKNSTLKYGIWLTGASMMFVSAWFCVRLTGTVGEMGRYLDSMDSVVCMEELLDYEKEENGRTMEENDLAEPTLQVRMLNGRIVQQLFQTARSFLSAARIIRCF